MPMPIFHDDREPTTPPPARAYDHRDRHARDALPDPRDRVWSVDYLRAPDDSAFFGWHDERRGGDYGQSMLDRAALIERLKRSQSPPVQHHHTVSIRPATTQKPREEPAHADPQSTGTREERFRPRTASANGWESNQGESHENAQDNTAAGLSIERPRSALHSGDFRQERDYHQLRPRGPSMTNETSPLQHAPMVGSYEESILRGRMSTTPSRPLNFIAQIGVLGKGDCKANLRCPAHVTLPFPAVFYSYNSGNGRIADNQPSPYVGLVDLENHLKPAEEQEEKRRRRRHARSDNQGENEEHDHYEGVGDAQQRSAHRKREKMKRRSTSPKSPPGGSYRIPQKGQLQIVIKNPNKTAVKLFLVPYDLGDMEPGQKTFVRQRSYSAGPIIDMPLNKRTNFGTDRPEASLSTSEDPNDRPTLRYLIHLHICCPSKGRYFLYKSIRVVFANRVPDGKEKLRNEIQLPEPRYSAYKPARESQGAPQSSKAPSTSASEKAMRRRSAGLSLSHGQARYDRFDELDFGSPSDSYVGCQTYACPIEPIAPIPFKLSRRLEPVESRPGSRDQMDVDGSSRRTSHAGSLSSQGNYSSLGSDQTWEKRAAGSFSPPPSHTGAGLLAQRLKGLQTSTNEAHTKSESNSSA
ncbi:hypothetical protein SLS58_001493 [Diplodia intermedia]|uniref:Atos-like conserved domain-containing protein n=1 Tax=Diplodia intermedia TaxID=856260 RepID=A0ABR3U1F1_9PEZI